MEADELREMDEEELEEALRDTQQELMHERGVAAMGGQPPDPGRIRELRKTVARIRTIMHEETAEDQRGTA
jgi:large subunit ribosomal protein L29